jgi:hypothetical protein
LGDTDVDGRIILKLMFKCGMDIDWIDLAQDRDRWWAHLKVVLNLPVS